MRERTWTRMRWEVALAAGIINAVSSVGGALAQSTTVYAYDALGRVTDVQDGAGSRSIYSFDPAGNRQTVSTRQDFANAWEAENLPHRIGFADQNGWAANVQTLSDYLTFGPYATNVPIGHRVATWRMAIDYHNAGDCGIVLLDASDFTTGQQLASRTVYRHEWYADSSYQIFELPFDLSPSQSGHQIELRTYYFGCSYIRIDKIGYY